MELTAAHVIVLLVSVGLVSPQSTKDQCEAGSCEETEVEVLRGLLMQQEQVSGFVVTGRNV